MHIRIKVLFSFLYIKSKSGFIWYSLKPAYFPTNLWSLYFGSKISLFANFLIIFLTRFKIFLSFYNFFNPFWLLPACGVNSLEYCTSYFISKYPQTFRQHFYKFYIYEDFFPYLLLL